MRIKKMINKEKNDLNFNQIFSTGSLKKNVWSSAFKILVD